MLASTVRSNGITGAILKQFVYAYDKAGNRTSQQIDSGVTKANHNNLNQLTDSAGGGPMRFAGRLSEPGTVLVGTNSAAMGIQNTSFVAYVQTSIGTNVIAVAATDYSNNSATNNYQIAVTNGATTKTLSYDLNGNLERGQFLFLTMDSALARSGRTFSSCAPLSSMGSTRRFAERREGSPPRLPL